MVEAFSWATARFADNFSGKAASFALGLKAEVKAELDDRSTGVRVSGSSSLRNISDLVLKVSEGLGYSYGFNIEVRNMIPSGIGLGDEEAEAVACVLAVAGALAKEHGSVNELKIDRYLKEQFIMLGNQLIDRRRLIDLCQGFGEFDRLCASMCGGFAVTDNRRGGVLRRGEMESMKAVVAVPKHLDDKDNNPVRLRLYRNESEIFFEEALKGNLYTVMKLNALLYFEVLSEYMLKAGALTVTVSYPAVVGLCRDVNRLRDVEAAVSRHASAVYTTSVVNSQAAIAVKPFRIVKTKEFIEMMKMSGCRYQLL